MPATHTHTKQTRFIYNDYIHIEGEFIFPRESRGPLEGLPPIQSIERGAKTPLQPSSLPNRVHETLKRDSSTIDSPFKK